MFRKNTIVVIVKNVSLILFGMLIAILLIVTFSEQHFSYPEAYHVANAANSEIGRPSQQVETTTEAGETWITCRPVRVAAYVSRIHVMCAESVGGIRFFALSTSSATHAARVLSVLSTAHVAGKTLNILYNPGDTSGGAIGCSVNDCRLILAAEMEGS